MTRAPSLPDIKENQVISGDVAANGIDELQQQHSATQAKRPTSGVFSGAGDSGVWPGAQPAAGALAFITPTTIIYILVWYVTGALTNSTSKQTLSLFKSDNKPFMSLTLMQHLAAAACGTFAIRVLRLKPHKSLPAEAMSWGFYRLIAVYTVGFCLTNGSFGKVNASFVDTIKAGEPIATVLLTVICLPGERVTALVFLSLLPIVAGVATSSLSEASFNLLGFCMAMGSNLCFSARSICAKLLRSSLGKQMDNANLFVYINLYGAMALLPFAIYAEGPLLLNVLSGKMGDKAQRFFCDERRLLLPEQPDELPRPREGRRRHARPHQLRPPRRQHLLRHRVVRHGRHHVQRRGHHARALGRLRLHEGEAGVLQGPCLAALKFALRQNAKGPLRRSRRRVCFPNCTRCASRRVRAAAGYGCGARWHVRVSISCRRPREVRRLSPSPERRWQARGDARKVSHGQSRVAL